MNKENGDHLVLKRSFGMREAVTITVGTVIGVGLFTTGAQIVGLMGSAVVLATFIAMLISVAPQNPEKDAILGYADSWVDTKDVYDMDIRETKNGGTEISLLGRRDGKRIITCGASLLVNGEAVEEMAADSSEDVTMQSRIYPLPYGSMIFSVASAPHPASSAYPSSISCPGSSSPVSSVTFLIPSSSRLPERLVI